MKSINSYQTSSFGLLATFDSCEISHARPRTTGTTSYLSDFSLQKVAETSRKRGLK